MLKPGELIKPLPPIVSWEIRGMVRWEGVRKAEIPTIKGHGFRVIICFVVFCRERVT